MNEPAGTVEAWRFQIDLQTSEYVMIRIAGRRRSLTKAITYQS
jgi:hypothetical protein